MVEPSTSWPDHAHGERGSRTRAVAVASALRPVIRRYRAVLAVAVTARLLWFVIFRTTVSNDSRYYLRVAAAIRAGRWAALDGFQQFGYGAAISILGETISVIRVIQHVCAIVACVVIAETVATLGGAKFWASAAGLVAALAPGMLVAESAVLTEAFTILLVSLAAWTFARTVTGKASIRALGVVSALPMLLRPNLFGLPLVLLIGAVAGRARPVRLLTVWLLPAVCIWIGQSSITYANSGTFTPAWAATAYGPPSHMLSIIEADRVGPAALRDQIVSARDSLAARHPGLASAWG